MRIEHTHEDSYGKKHLSSEEMINYRIFKNQDNYCKSDCTKLFTFV